MGRRVLIPCACVVNGLFAILLPAIGCALWWLWRRRCRWRRASACPCINPTGHPIGSWSHQARRVSGAWDRPVQRVLRLTAGLVLFGLSLALLVRAGLGLDPWDMFTQGVARRTLLIMGQVTILISLLVAETLRGDLLQKLVCGRLSDEADVASQPTFLS